MLETYNADSLLFILPGQAEEERVNSLNRLSVSLFFEKHDESVAYAEEAMNLAKELDYEEGMADAYRNFGHIYQYDWDFPKALNNYFEALELYDKLGMKRSVGKVYHDIAKTHYFVRNFDKSIEYLLMALEKFRERTENGATVGNLKDTMNIHGSLSLIYLLMGKYDKSLESTLLCLEVGKKNNFGIADMLIYTIVAGERFHSKGEKDSAIVYLEKALRYPDVNPTIETMKFRAIYSLGNIYYSEGAYDSAVVYYRRAYENYDEKGFLIWAMGLSNKLGLFYYRKKEFNSAEHYFLQSEKFFAEMLVKKSWYRHDSLKLIASFGLELYFPMPPVQMKRMMWHKGRDMYYMLFKISETKNKTGEALKYYIAYSNAKDTVNRLHLNRETVELQTRYESDRKDQQIGFLSRENEFKDTRIRQSMIIVFSQAGLVMLVVILAIVLLRQNRLREQQKNLLLQQKLFRSQMNPHFLFNSLSSIHNYIIHEEPARAGQYLSKFSKLVRNILECSVEEYIPLEEEISTIENYLELQKLRFPDKFDYSVEVDKAIDTESLNIPPMLLQPFIENSIEHGFKHKEGKGNIKISFTSKNGMLLVELQDDGIGREKAQELLFKHNQDHKSLATALIRERIQALNKRLKKKIVLTILDLKNEKNEPVGTKVALEIPIES